MENVEGMAFAIPNDVRKIQQLEDNGKVHTLTLV